VTDYIHSYGLKAASHDAGPMTCAGYGGTYGMKSKTQAVRRLGLDLKYDWCHYSKIAKNEKPDELKSPTS
jgi:hypothetical protein